ncbi:hypothetical protein M3Y95_01067800 [Aphelenchoides besseyi]|nr:hypothetical protein M3Y95_01067800 [Aphelenchoides besseyi]
METDEFHASEVYNEEIVEGYNFQMPTSSADDVYEFKSSPEESTLVNSVGEFEEEDEILGSRKRTEEPMEAEDYEDERKVPPLRILLMPKTNSEDDKIADPDHVPSAKKPRTRKQPEKRATLTSRVTRSSVRQSAREQTPVKSPDGPPAKRSRPQRRAAQTTIVRRVETQLPSTSTSLTVTSTNIDQISVGSPPDPNLDEASRSSGSDCDTNFNLQQPERLSDEVRNLFELQDLGAFSGLKRMLSQRWSRDFQQQQSIAFVNHKPASSPPKRRNPFDMNKVLWPETKTTSASAVMTSHINQQRHMYKRHLDERDELSEFIEREFVRQLNDLPGRSRSAVTCMRILADNDVYNANVLDMNTEELNKISIRSREEIVTQMKEKMEILIKNTFNRHKMEAESLYYQQCYEWERHVFDQLPADRRAKIEDFNLRDCVKRIETKRIDLAALLN